MTDDGHVLTLEGVIVNLVEHGVSDVPVELALAFVSLRPGQGEIAGEHGDARSVEDLCLLLLAAGVGNQLPITQPLGFDLLDGDVVHIGGLLGLLHPNLLDVGVQADVWHNPLLLSHILEHVQESVARRPRCREISWNLVLLAIAEMVSPVLGLQLRGAVRLIHPRCSANSEHAIKDNEVGILPLAQEHCHAKTDVPSTDDHLRVLMLLRFPLERLDPLDKHLRPHLLMRVHSLIKGANLLNKNYFSGRHVELPRYSFRNLFHGGARLYRNVEVLIALHKLQVRNDSRPACLHSSRGSALFVVLHFLTDVGRQDSGIQEQ
mmetsp:Transcript_115493/g.257972  ORF Transcript_115493/g.257972 Transcript_115493/m.257972 type:complete len:320 (-) Transcript_115493:79-1038(-)